MSANRHLKSSCPIHRNRGSSFEDAQVMAHDNAPRLRNRKPTRSLKRTFDHDLYIYFLPLDPVSLSQRPILLDTPLIWTFGDRCSPSNDPSDRRTYGRVLWAPLSRLWGATRMAWTGHPLTLGVLPGPNPPRWSKQAETWPDPRISPAWTRMTTRLNGHAFAN